MHAASLQATPLLDGADPERGREGFETGGLDFIQCVTCHALPSGGLGTVISGDLLMDSQSMKVAPLRNMYEKTGMDKTSMSGSKGFGFEHDGADATLVEFFEREVFTFPSGAAGDQLRRDVSAFMLFAAAIFNVSWYMSEYTSASTNSTNLEVLLGRAACHASSGAACVG